MCKILWKHFHCLDIRQGFFSLGYFLAMLSRLSCVFSPLLEHMIMSSCLQCRKKLVTFSPAAFKEFNCIVYRFLLSFSRRCFIQPLSRKYYTNRFRQWLKYGTWANLPSFKGLPQLRLYCSHWNQKKTSGINSHPFNLLALSVWLLLF